jgi:hypothetical protein
LIPLLTILKFDVSIFLIYVMFVHTINHKVIYSDSWISTIEKSN